MLHASSGAMAYEVEERFDDFYNGLFLLVRLPEALLKADTAGGGRSVASARFARDAVGKLKITLPNRNQEGFQFVARSDVRPYSETTLGQDSMALLRLLAMRMKSVLDLRELFAASYRWAA